MKKIISLLLVAIMIISLFVACDKASDTQTSDTEATEDRHPPIPLRTPRTA